MRRLLAVLLLLVAGGGSTAAAGAAMPGIRAALRLCLARQVSSSPSQDACLLSSITQERADKGLGPLSENPSTDALAQGWAEHMASGGCGGSPPYWNICHNLSGFHQSFSTYSEENVAEGTNCGSGDKYDVVVLFLNSPEHYANIVNPKPNTIGVGSAFYDGPEGTALFVTEDFETVSPGPAPAPAPSPAPAPKPLPTTPAPRPASPTLRSSTAPPAATPAPSSSPASSSSPETSVSPATPITETTSQSPSPTLSPAPAPIPRSAPPWMVAMVAGLAVLFGVGVAVATRRI